MKSIVMIIFAYGSFMMGCSLNESSLVNNKSDLNGLWICEGSNDLLFNDDYLIITNNIKNESHIFKYNYIFNYLVITSKTGLISTFIINNAINNESDKLYTNGEFELILSIVN